jgi:hypothetical protein
MMGRGTIRVIVSLLLMMPIGPTAWAEYSSGVEHMDERTASFLASPFVAAFDPVPLEPRLQVDAPVPPPPPGMCRWERTVFDGHGRPVLDRSGRPVKEYAIGSCVTPPPD